jgi:hypothetical protein
VQPISVYGRLWILAKKAIPRDLRQEAVRILSGASVKGYLDGSALSISALSRDARIAKKFYQVG